jgi:hypothetical protein
MSEIKVNKLSPRSGTDVTLGDSGDTFTVPAGASIVNNGTSTGFGPTGAVTWDTTAKTANFNAVSKVGYFVDTTLGAITVTLPATPSAGDIVGLVDYAGTFDTNALTIDGNGEDIEGAAINFQLTGDREGVVLIYVDSTQGWLPISGINEGTDALSPAPYSIDFLVVAGGGGGGHGNGGGGGGGAGGFRTSTETVNTGVEITVTVGDGGAGSASSGVVSSSGSNSSISGSGLTTITSAGGGGAGTYSGVAGVAGGSGGGGGGSNTTGGAGGSGNTPSTVPSQGNNGGAGTTNGNTPYINGGGGGGASAIGTTPTNVSGGGNGGDGTASSITGSSVPYAGGGGGGAENSPAGGGTGGTGGGGNGGKSGNVAGTAGTINTGGGGGGGGYSSAPAIYGANGGKGVVILSMPLANFSNTTTGSPTESDDGTTKVLIFNGDGSYTA